ncbi:hypothetical protein [Chryseobacterium sp. MFBS3-17]|uniref:hypothetical protein n=1 Tax=Chryseobacterium sp. MFBS3-17 TaxID=2886689 RepID=UPI001D0E9D3B|nr:hypothetical protein [Chryseobacterium sp. MFBS3-17]MCC2591324.1 hypothetical protein [Chryseobacterium sp. MFBS3-17]
MIIIPGKPKDICTQTKNTLENSNVEEGIEDLIEFLDTPEAEKNETGFTEDFNGNISMTTVGEYSTTSGPAMGHYGVYHVHPNGLGSINIFSPKDIASLIDYALVQTPSSHISNGYVGLIAKEPCANCPGGIKYIHYVIRFTGTPAQMQNLQLPFSENKLRKWSTNQTMFERTLRDAYKNVPDNGFINQEGREKVFFKTLQDMGLESLITLQRIENNSTIINITQDADGSINLPIICN